MRMIRGGKLVSHMRKREIHKAFWWQNLKEKEHFEELVANRRILLK
jgi:hypothetical protein